MPETDRPPNAGASGKTILCLCGEEYHWKLIPGYAAALRRRGVEFWCLGDALALDAPLEEALRECPRRPDWIFHFESGRPVLPTGLEKSEIPTVCFQADTYAYTRKRIRWSSLFDHAVVFHPGYERIFREAGHPGAFLLPHAVRREHFEGPEREREFEVGWVGQASGAVYGRRAKWLPRLASEFRTNDWGKQYKLEEVAEVYRKSRVVVNFSRDDFPQDANLRVFEAMASGALLITSLPSELTELDFEEGVHFAGYRKEAELLPQVRRYLSEEAQRKKIGDAGRAKVLSEHTYDCRVTQLLAHLERAGSQKLAPARRWPESRVRLALLDFFAAHGVLDCAAKQYRKIAGRNVRDTIEGAGLLAKGWAKRQRVSRRSPA